MTGPYELGEVPGGRRRRATVVASVAMVAIAVALLIVVIIIEGVRPAPVTWALLALAAAVVVAGLAYGIRTFTPDERATVEQAQRRVPEPLPADGDAAHDVDLDLTDLPDPLASIPDDQTVLADADAGEFELTEGPTVRVVLHPGPITRRRLVGRADALVVVADAVALDVPGWIVEGRSRVIERTDRVLVPWASIQRFRVRADRDGADVYDITARPDAPAPHRWRIRRNEIGDELTLLDHVRRVGRVTIELEDSIRS